MAQDWFFGILTPTEIPETFRRENASRFADPASAKGNIGFGFKPLELGQVEVVGFNGSLLFPEFKSDKNKQTFGFGNLPGGVYWII